MKRLLQNIAVRVAFTGWLGYLIFCAAIASDENASPPERARRCPR